MKEFERYHPLVNLIYFVFVIVFACVFMHPVCLGVSFVCAFIYSILIKGFKRAIKSLCVIVPLILVTALVNPVFNHRGVTILMYFPDGNPLTLESIIYGIGAAFMIASVIMWFSCFNEIMSSDKYVYLFGKIMPAMSLILSMVLRFVPKFKAQYKDIANAQICIGKDTSKGSLITRCKNTAKVVSINISRSLEESIDTADSMKSRGYGLEGRTAFSTYKFTTRDWTTLIFTLAACIYIFIGGILGNLNFYYFPTISGPAASPYGVSLTVIYCLYCMLPILLEIKEARKWKY